MSEKKNKVGRPRKEARAKSIVRVPIMKEKPPTHVTEKESLRPLERLVNDPDFAVKLQNVRRKTSLEYAITDPFEMEKMPAKAFGYTLLANDPDEDASMGAMLCGMMRDMSADSLQSLFDAIIRMKRNSDFLHRNSYAYYAYCKYLEAYGTEPTKYALKTYILEHPRQYKDAPSEDDKTGWTRLWKAVGLENLKSR
jgi:hypothetical protein